MNINAAKYNSASDITVKATLINKNDELIVIESLLKNTIKKHYSLKAKVA